jgi:hypothetical protein
MVECFLTLPQRKSLPVSAQFQADAKFPCLGHCELEGYLLKSGPNPLFQLEQPQKLDDVPKECQDLEELIAA